VEILLNSVWALLALLIVTVWLRLEVPEGTDRRRQIIVILILIAILFPVISVSDDLMAMQSATEQDGLQRRDYLAASSAHPVLLFAAIVPALIIEMSPGSPPFISIRGLPRPSIERAVLSVSGNRPPPGLERRRLFHDS